MKNRLAMAIYRAAWRNAVEFADEYNQAMRWLGLVCLAFLMGGDPAPVYGQFAQIPWDVQQDRPVAHDVTVWQGETVDLLPRLVQGVRAVAITNAPVEFRYREASLPTNTYRYVAASANTNNGVVSVRWLPDYDAGAAWYDYQIIVGSNAANPRCFGRIIMRPTIGWHASTNPPPPVTLYPTRAEFQAASNALAVALQSVTEAQAQASVAIASNTAAITAIPQPTGLPVWYDAHDSNVFATIEGAGTGIWWRVEATRHTYVSIAGGAAHKVVGQTAEDLLPVEQSTSQDYNVTGTSWGGYAEDTGQVIQLILIGDNEQAYLAVASTGSTDLLAQGIGTNTGTAHFYVLLETATNFVSRIATTNDVAALLSRYVPATNGTAENLNLSGNVTIGGVTRATWPTELSPAITNTCMQFGVGVSNFWAGLEADKPNPTIPGTLYFTLAPAP